MKIVTKFSIGDTAYFKDREGRYTKLVVQHLNASLLSLGSAPFILYGVSPIPTGFHEGIDEDHLMTRAEAIERFPIDMSDMQRELFSLPKLCEPNTGPASEEGKTP